jgi:nucleoside 2-deoxyribosyltransferase
MECVADHGIEWRRKFIRLVEEADLKIDCIDPTNKPGGDNMRIGENKEFQAQLQRDGKWAELKHYVHQYRRADLRFVDYSDFLVAVIDPRVPQWGTSNEIYEAERQHKPMFFVVDGGLKNLPRWLFDVIDLDGEVKGNMWTVGNVFESIEAVVKRLQLLDQGIMELTDEWVLVRRHIEESRKQLKA